MNLEARLKAAEKVCQAELEFRHHVAAMKQIVEDSRTKGPTLINLKEYDRRLNELADMINDAVDEWEYLMYIAQDVT